MTKHDTKRENDIEWMLKEDIFMTLKIDQMNWGILIANEDVDVYYEVTL